MRHPRLRRVALAAIAASLVLLIAVTKGRDASAFDLASLVLAAVVGALGAAAAARTDAAILRSFPDRARRWTRIATTAGVLIGTVAAVALARSGSVDGFALVAAFLVGLLVAVTFLYPLDRRDAAETRPPT